LRLTQKLIYAFTEKEKAQLLKEINTTKPLPEKKWLLEQLNVS
jgi:hypothetical protein